VKNLKCKFSKLNIRNLFGKKFNSPLGLAAGFDKDAKLYNSMTEMGFSFVGKK
jgi:dihydroorotate dehydrogenase